MKYLRKFNEALKSDEKNLIGNTKLSDYHPENGIDKGFTELENDLSKLFFMKDKIKYNFDLQDNSKTVDMNLFFIVFSEDEKYTEFEVSTEELTKIDTVYDLYNVMKNKLKTSSFTTIHDGK